MDSLRQINIEHILINEYNLRWFNNVIKDDYHNIGKMINYAEFKTEYKFQPNLKDIFELFE